METAKLTVRLPKEDIEFAKRYARAHRLTVTELIDRHLRQLRSQTEAEIHPEVEKFSGLVPAGVDARAEYQEHLLKKHRSLRRSFLPAMSSGLRSDSGL